MHWMQCAAFIATAVWAEQSPVFLANLRELKPSLLHRTSLWPACNTWEVPHRTFKQYTFKSNTFSKGYNKSQVSSREEFDQNMKILFRIFTWALPEIVLPNAYSMLRAAVFSGKPAASSCTRCTHFKQARVLAECAVQEITPRCKVRCLRSLRTHIFSV